MAKRKKSKRRSRSSKISLLNIAESYTYLTIMTAGLMGSNPYEFLTSGSDIRSVDRYDAGLGITSSHTTGTSSLSLTELFKEPDIAFGAVRTNFMGNWQNMVIASMVTSIGFGVGKKLLRKPIANVNRNIFKPLGVGVKL